MKTSTKFWMLETVSSSTAPIRIVFAPDGAAPTFLGLVKEPSAFEPAGALLCAHFHVSRRQQEHLVGDALHAAVERVRETARKVDQPLRQIRVGALQVEDDWNRLLELVRNLLRVVEASRHDEVDGRR